MKKYISLIPMLIIVGLIFYDAAMYMYERYLLIGKWSVGYLAPFSVFMSTVIIIGLACVSFGYGLSCILEEKK